MGLTVCVCVRSKYTRPCTQRAVLWYMYSLHPGKQLTWWPKDTSADVFSQWLGWWVITSSLLGPEVASFHCRLHYERKMIPWFSLRVCFWVAQTDAALTQHKRALPNIFNAFSPGRRARALRRPWTSCSCWCFPTSFSPLVVHPLHPPSSSRAGWCLA